MTNALLAMKAIIFAGGVGTRMWPLSRKKSPKQFDPIIEGKSTLQLTVERILPSFSPANIFISTGKQYLSIIQEQLPQIPKKNIIGEPQMRDVAPAVGYMMTLLAKDNPQMPVAILWSDHLVERPDIFRSVLQTGAKLLKEQSNRFIFIGQKPRFANQNLGWIEYGDVIGEVGGLKVHQFKSWHYRPDLDTAKAYLHSHRHAWNPGYFVVTPEYVLNQYRTHVPDMYKQLKIIAQSLGTKQEQSVIDQVYPSMEKISFDDAVVTKTPPNKAVVIAADLGWSDVGTWEALKEALQSHPEENITTGNVQPFNTTNSLIYSYTRQLVATIDINDMVVVVTKDAILVTPHRSIPHIKALLKQFEGTALEKYS